MGANQLVPKRPPTFMMGGWLGKMGATQAPATTTPSGRPPHKVSQHMRNSRNGASPPPLSPMTREGNPLRGVVEKAKGVVAQVWPPVQGRTGVSHDRSK